MITRCSNEIDTWIIVLSFFLSPFPVPVEKFENFSPLEISNYLLVQSSTIFKNNLFASKKHQCIKVSEEKHDVKIRIFSKRRRHVFRWNNWPQFDRVIRAPHLGCARIFDPVPPTRPGIITREPRYRLPNSRVNLRRDDRRGEGEREREKHGCELLDIRNKGMPPNYSRTVSYAALVTKVT